MSAMGILSPVPFVGTALSIPFFKTIRQVFTLSRRIAWPPREFVLTLIP